MITTKVNFEMNIIVSSTVYTRMETPFIHVKLKPKGKQPVGETWPIFLFTHKTLEKGSVTWPN